MFDALRRMIVPIIGIVLVFFIGMIILEWGMDFSGRQQYDSANVAGVINGEEVSWQRYNTIYNNMVQTEQQKSEDEIPDGRLRELQAEAWKQLVQDELIQQEVRKNNIVVTDQEIFEYLAYTPPMELRSLPYFQTNGQFDYQKYQQAMLDPQASPFWAQIEAAARGDLAKYKAQELVLQNVNVTESEVREWFLAGSEKVTVGMINVDFGRIPRTLLAITPADLEAYFNEHKEKYTINERAALNVVLVERAPQPSDWETAYNKAKAIYDSIQAGADFAEMAGIYTEEPAGKTNGGDLGWFARGRMVAEFDKWTFQLNPGQISEPIRTQFGWHIIKLHEKKTESETPPGKTQPEMVEKVHASHILFTAKPSQETLDNAYRRLEAFRADALSDGFFKAAEAHQFPVRNTGLFFRGRNIQYLGNDPQAGLFAFNGEIDAISEVWENNSAIYVVQVAEKRPKGPATFEESRERVELDLQAERAGKIALDSATVIYNELRAGGDPAAVAKRHGQEYKTPEPFARTGYVDGIRRDPLAIGAAFGLTTPGELSKPIAHEQGVVIFKLISKESPDMLEYTQKQDSVRNAILNNKRQDLYTRWMESQVANADIKNYVQEAFEGQRQPQ